MKKSWLKMLVAGLVILNGGAVSAAGPQVGKKAPEFNATDIEGKTRSLSEFKGKYVVLEWVNYGCPFVKKHYDATSNMQDLQKKWTAKGVVWLSICSSAQGRQGYYEAEKWRELVKEKGVKSSAVLLDPSGKVGKLYEAKTTPHMFVVDPKGVLIYKGAIDDEPSTDGDDVAKAKNYVSQALEEAMAGKTVSESSTQSYGCSVKY